MKRFLFKIIFMFVVWGVGFQAFTNTEWMQEQKQIYLKPAEDLKRLSAGLVGFSDAMEKCFSPSTGVIPKLEKNLEARLSKYKVLSSKDDFNSVYQISVYIYPLQKFFDSTRQLISHFIQETIQCLNYVSTLDRLFSDLQQRSITTQETLEDLQTLTSVRQKTSATVLYLRNLHTQLRELHHFFSSDWADQYRQEKIKRVLGDQKNKIAQAIIQAQMQYTVAIYFVDEAQKLYSALWKSYLELDFALNGYHLVALKNMIEQTNKLIERARLLLAQVPPEYKDIFTEEIFASLLKLAADRIRAYQELLSNESLREAFYVELDSTQRLTQGFLLNFAKDIRIPAVRLAEINRFWTTIKDLPQEGGPALTDMQLRETGMNLYQLHKAITSVREDYL